MIISNEAYFSLPCDFNDPFDCNIVPEIKYTQDEFDNFENSLNERDTSQISQEDIEQLLKNPVKVLEQNWRDSIINVRNNLRVFCLSAVNNNVMMFSHYADSHKGVCLEFIVSDIPFYSEIDYVRYKESIPVFHPFHDNINFTRKELIETEVFTKAKSWCYEKEWRVIKSGPNPSIHKFPTGILSSIIFGYQTPKQDKILIEKIIESRTPTIQLKQAVKKEKSFDIEIKNY